MSKRNPVYEITPLGAAFVEAMPNSKKMRCVEALFKCGQCPVSCLFSADAIEQYYNGRVKPVAKP